jgi:hypothetical protein
LLSIIIKIQAASMCQLNLKRLTLVGIALTATLGQTGCGAGVGVRCHIYQNGICVGLRAAR